MERGSVTITNKVIKITKIKKDYIVFFSNNITLTLIEDELLQYNIYKGKELNNKEIKEINDNHLFNLYYFSLKHKIINKPLSINEAKNFLKNKFLDELLINNIINRLIDENLLDEYKLGIILKEECFYKLKGVKYYSWLLKNKGISYDTYQDLINNYQEEKMLENLTVFFESYKKGLISLPTNLQTSKISQKMARNGFLEETIKKVLEKLIFE